MLKQQQAQKMVEACILDKKEDVYSLLKEGVNPNCYEDSLTPLIACIENNNFELGKYLLNSGASISYKPEINSANAFWYALKNRSYNFLELFISRKCFLSREIETNKTPLIYSTIESDKEAVRILLNHARVRVNERDGEGNTALHYNMSKSEMKPEDHEIGVMLIAAGADVNATNLEGKRPEEVIMDSTAAATLLAAKLDKELPVNQPEIDPETEKPKVTKKLKL